jgi:glycosyltransferase involved in cell wall biosynthesis
MYSDSMSYVTRCSAIAAMGNEFNARSWREVFNGPIYPFNNCGFNETRPPVESKDSQRTKLNFLFFAGGCQVQKGLDLLLEIFPKYPHLHLYVCSPFEQENDFCDCYYNELYKTPNVHPVGWVQVNSPHFYELTDKCAFVILPSCSEGQPSSVVQCMHSGLIPLVTKQAGIDTEDFGVTFSDDSIEAIERAVLEVSELPTSWISTRSAHTFGAAKEKFSEDAFVDKWRKMLSEILDLRAQTHL